MSVAHLLANDLARESYKAVVDRAWRPAPLSGSERMRMLAERAIQKGEPLTRREVEELAASVLDCLNQHTVRSIVDSH